jgi:hypothetical protein
MRKNTFNFLAVFTNKTFPTIWILFFALWAVQAQAQQIKSTDPYQYAEYAASGTIDLELLGNDMIPPGSTFQTLPQDVKVYFDDGSGWKQGSIVIPGKGWGTGNLTVKTPWLNGKAPGMKVKLVVKGVDSNVYTIPIFVINTSGPPKIISIKPDSTAQGASDFWFLIEVFTNGSAGGQLFFNGQQVSNYIFQAQTPDVMMYRFSVPQSLRATPGQYPIQLKGPKGDTNIIYWRLVPPVLNCKKDTGGQMFLCSSCEYFNDCKKIMASVGQENQCSFDPAVMQNKCPVDSQTQMRLCSSLDDYKFCLQTMGCFNQSNQCGFTAYVAKQAVDEVDSYFKTRGSLIPCDRTYSNLPNMPGIFDCKRPMQGKQCQAHVLPKLVNCKVTEAYDYQTLKGQVNQAVATLNSKYNGPPWLVHTEDPLLWNIKGKDLPPELRTALFQPFGFGPPSSKSGFDDQTDMIQKLPFDGLSTPTIGKTLDVNTFKKAITTPVVNIEDKLKSMQPGPDPRNISPDISSESLMNKLDGKALKNGDMLKIIGGQVFIRTKAGKQMAVQDQMVELQDGTKITFKGGKILQQSAPGMNR